VWPLAYLGALSATSLILAVHRRSLCGLFSGPAALVMHSAWAAGFFTGLLVVNERRWDAGDSEALPLRPGSMPSEGR
jgi:succinoglycan biosynthesis protein ExoA